MPTQEKIILHALPPSRPCMTAEAGLKYKGLEYERVELTMGSHGTEVDELYGEGARTVPGMMIGEEAVHGSVPILRRLEEMVPEKPLYPEPIAERVRAAEEWADGHFQDLGRRLPWGALHFRPEAMGITCRSTRKISDWVFFSPWAAAVSGLVSRAGSAVMVAISRSPGSG